ncbi:hypothetical protein [Formosa sp. A9]|uniref:hypothetical protein n=1 Tax=Formosa sp. A9 TaxID=3442641 RepID=UPI003EBFDE5F
MKNIFKLFMLIGVLASFVSCSDDDHQLGEKLDPSELEFTVVQDYAIDEGGNTVVLTNNTPQTVAYWNYQTGTSNKNQLTVQYAFAGEYTIQFSATTDGGLVEAVPVTITVTENNLNYVSDPLWTSLSGGVGENKSWIPDNGQYGMAPGFLSYADPANGTPEFDNFTTNWEPEGLPPGSTEDDVDWDAIMNFSLDGGPFMTVYDGEGNLTESGTYFLDKDAKTLTTSDATILRPENYIANASNWNNDLQIVTLDENQLRIAVFRTNDEGDWWYIWNYVSKDYADNYVPEETGPEEPDLPEGWEDTISEITTTAIEWKLSESNPLDWANLDGSMMNGWQNPEDYPDWLGTPDTAVYGGFSMTMDSADNTVVFVTPDGTTTEGTYTVSNSGIYSFSIPVPTFPLINWANFAPDANNQLRILDIKTNTNGNITDLWLGAVDNVDEPGQYTAYHLVPNAGNSGGADQPKELAVDNSKILFGDLENNGNFRIEIFNEFGSGTAGDPPIDLSELVFSESMEITFTLNGITLNDDAVGTYAAYASYSDPDWAPAYWGDGSGPGDTTVNGDGTYTVSFTIDDVAEGANVFVVDMAGLGQDITDIEAVTATIDKIIIK